MFMFFRTHHCRNPFGTFLKKLTNPSPGLTCSKSFNSNPLQRDLLLDLDLDLDLELRDRDLLRERRLDGDGERP